MSQCSNQSNVVHPAPPQQKSSNHPYPIINPLITIRMTQLLVWCRPCSGLLRPGQVDGWLPQRPAVPAEHRGLAGASCFPEPYLLTTHGNFRVSQYVLFPWKIMGKTSGIPCQSLEEARPLPPIPLPVKPSDLSFSSTSCSKGNALRNALWYCD